MGNDTIYTPAQCKLVHPIIQKGIEIVFSNNLMQSKSGSITHQVAIRVYGVHDRTKVSTWMIDIFRAFMVPSFL